MKNNIRLPFYQLLVISLSFCLQNCLSTNTEKSNPLTIPKQQISLGDGSKIILTYNAGELCPEGNLPKYYCRSGFIHPVYSPKGKILTDGFPTGHTHQHGLFFAWVNTEFRGDFVDFWNQQKETGTVRHKETTDIGSGLIPKSLRVNLEQLSKKHGPIIQEKWKIQVAEQDQYFAIDLVSTQVNNTTDTLFIKKYRYGGLGLRGSKEWNPKDPNFNGTIKFITNLGDERIESNHTRPYWTVMYGKIEEEHAGIAILDHPENLHFPQPIRVHPDMPYFCLAPMVADSIPFHPQQTRKFRYKIITFDGLPDHELLDSLSQAYQSQTFVE